MRQDVFNSVNDENGSGHFGTEVVDMIFPSYLFVKVYFQKLYCFVIVVCAYLLFNEIVLVCVAGWF